VDELGAVVLVRTRPGWRLKPHPIRIQLPLGRGEVEAFELPRRITAAKSLRESRAFALAHDADCSTRHRSRKEMIEADAEHQRDP
jgi:hypothetical protein